MFAETREEDAVTVVFRKWPKREGGGIIALFPEIPADDRGRFCSAYEHVGQHGGADYYGVRDRTRPATAAEYADLKRELESAPYHYRLSVRRRYTRRRKEG